MLDPLRSVRPNTQSSPLNSNQISGIESTPDSAPVLGSVPVGKDDSTRDQLAQVPALATAQTVLSLVSEQADFGVFMATIDDVMDAKRDVQVNSDRIQDLSDKADQNTRDLQQAQHDLSTAEDQAHQADGQIARWRPLQAFFTDKGLNADALWGAVLQDPKILQHLKSFGIDVHASKGGTPPELRFEGKSLNAKTLAAALGQMFNRDHTAWQGAHSHVARLKANIVLFRLDAHNIQMGLDAALNAQQRSRDAYRAAIEQLKKFDLEQLLTLTQDPDFMKQIADSPELQLAYRNAIKQARDEITGADAFLDHAQQIAQAGRSAQARHQAAQQTNGVDTKVKEPVSSPDPAQHMAVIQALEAQLSQLSTGPVNLSTSQQDAPATWWQESKAVYSQAMSRLQELRLAEQSQSRDHTRVLEHILDESKYHLKSLERLDQHHLQRLKHLADAH